MMIGKIDVPVGIVLDAEGCRHSGRVSLLHTSHAGKTWQHSTPSTQGWHLEHWLPASTLPSPDAGCLLRLLLRSGSHRQPRPPPRPGATHHPLLPQLPGQGLTQVR